MTEEETRQVQADFEDLRNHYEQTIKDLKARINELEKRPASGSSQRQKIASGSEK